jgi:hypothetical protein
VPTVPLAGRIGVTVIAGHETVIVRLAEVPMHTFASVALIVKVDAPAVVGVPVMAPVLVFRLKPAGSDPLATA